MKLIATMMMSLDGVFQGPGGPDEDRRGGFERGGWRRLSDDEGCRFAPRGSSARTRCSSGARPGRSSRAYRPHHVGATGLPRHQRPAQVRALDDAEGPDLAEHPCHRWRRRGGDPRAQGEARARDPGPRQRRATPVAPRAGPRRRAQPADLPRRRGRGGSAFPTRPHPRLELVESRTTRGHDAPDLSAGRAGDLRDRRRDDEDHRGDHDVRGRLHHGPGRRPGQGTRRRRGTPPLLGHGRPLEL